MREPVVGKLIKPAFAYRHMMVEGNIFHLYKRQIAIKAYRAVLRNELIALPSARERFITLPLRHIAFR